MYQVRLSGESIDIIKVQLLERLRRLRDAAMICHEDRGYVCRDISEAMSGTRRALREMRTAVEKARVSHAR